MPMTPLFCVLALATVATETVGQRTGPALASEAVANTYHVFLGGCDTTPYEFIPNLCMQWRGISFKVTPRPDGCTAGAALRVSYWETNTQCSGTPKTDSPVDTGKCASLPTSIGRISFLFRMEGVPDTAFCPFLKAMLKTDTRLPENKLIAVGYTAADCSGTPVEEREIALDTVGAEEVPTPQNATDRCVGCCPETPGRWSLNRVTCNEHGVFRATAEYTDAACQNIVEASKMALFESVCRTLPAGAPTGSARLVVPRPTTQGSCSAVAVMGLHSFSEWRDLATPERLLADMPWVGDMNDYDYWKEEDEGVGTVVFSSALLLLAACVALA